MNVSRRAGLPSCLVLFGLSGFSSSSCVYICEQFDFYTNDNVTCAKLKKSKPAISALQEVAGDSRRQLSFHISCEGHVSLSLRCHHQSFHTRPPAWMDAGFTSGGHHRRSSSDACDQVWLSPPVQAGPAQGDHFSQELLCDMSKEETVGTKLEERC